MAADEPAIGGSAPLRRIRNGYPGRHAVRGRWWLLGLAAAHAAGGTARRSHVVLLTGMVLLARAHIG